MKISIIVAMASNRVIGFENGLPWCLPADLRHFKRLTVGHHLLMGRRTFESLDGPLPNRTIVVITRNEDYAVEGVNCARSLPAAIKLAEEDDEIFIAGGAQIYAEAFTLSDRMYMTLIHQEFTGDTYFPVFDEDDWIMTERQDYASDAENPYPYSFLTYHKKEESPHLRGSK